MGYWETVDWQKIKKDVQKGWQEGVAVVKEGAIVAQKKAGELTDEGKRRYRIFELKTKVHKQFYDLGGRVYSLMGAARPKSPGSDSRVKAIVAEIKKHQVQIDKLEHAVPKGAPKQRKKS
jgi:uncharacterized protein YcnI